jgi:hypothetical protein
MIATLNTAHKGSSRYGMVSPRPPFGVEEFPLRKTDDALYEYACHEGNCGIVGVPSGARVEEKAAKEAGGKK